MSTFWTPNPACPELPRLPACIHVAHAPWPDSQDAYATLVTRSSLSLLRNGFASGDCRQRTSEHGAQGPGSGIHPSPHRTWRRGAHPYRSGGFGKGWAVAAMQPPKMTITPAI